MQCFEKIHSEALLDVNPGGVKARQFHSSRKKAFVVQGQEQCTNLTPCKHLG